MKKNFSSINHLSPDHELFLKHVESGMRKMELDAGERGIYLRGVANVLRVVQKEGGFTFGLPQFNHNFIRRAHQLILEVPLGEKDSSEEKSWELGFADEDIGKRIIQEVKVDFEKSLSKTGNIER